MKKKAFTLVELLAVIVILGIVLIIAVPRIGEIVTNSKVKMMVNNEKMFVKAAKNYLAANSNLGPVIIGSSIEITLNDLVSNRVLPGIESPNGTDCNGYVIVTKVDNLNYNYEPHLNCDVNIANLASDGLLAHYTFNDYAESTTNLIPGGVTNSYPTVGNTHGTYNTNQYNNNVYFSIGTIANITNNIVTLATVDRPIYTYDVLTPQTTGGGVTAGTNYFIKRISANSFSLHPYNSSQDGSQGFRVYDSINNDIRVNINASGFPTMWNGRPHLANSALVKELIPNCFSSIGVVHDCIRLNTNHKPEGSVDGMAYGVYPPVEAGKTYTFSFYYRAVDQASVGTTISLGLYTGASWPGASIAKTATLDWQRYEMTVVAPNTGGTNLYFWPIKNATIDITEIQCEQKNYATPFAVGTRLAFINDYSTNGNNATLQVATTPKWVSSGKIGGAYLFSGNNEITINHNANLNPTNLTLMAWVNPTTLPAATHQRIINKNFTSGYLLNLYGEKIEAYVGGQQIDGPNIAINEWVHVVVTTDGARLKFYANGNLINDLPYTGTINGSTANLIIGSYAGINYYNGKLDNIKIYNRAFTAEEIINTYKIENNY